MNDDLSKVALLVGGWFLFVLWLALLNGWGNATVWLVERKSRCAIVAGGLLGSVPGALGLCALCFDTPTYSDAQ